MQSFVQRHAESVTGVVSGWDRLLFRGTLLSLSHPQGMGSFLGSHRVMYKDYGRWAMSLSDRLKAHAQRMARDAGREFRYLACSSLRKEEVTRQIMQRDQIQQGLVCVLSCVEPCRTIGVQRERATKQLKLVKQQRKCLHLYFYYLDREFGLMHVRLQTWLPFGIQICINGREYLARRMQRAGIGHEQRDNCFVRIEDLPRAQKMLDALDSRRWARTLEAFARRVNPLIGPSAGLNIWGYYWTIRESEYATDVMFKDAASLQAVYPQLVDYAMKQMGSSEAMRFLGRRTNCRFDGEVVSDIRTRPEGMRIKHRVEENSIKMYDKQGSVLRIETTINNPKRLRVYRPVKRKGRRVMCWAKMRKGVADTQRRAQVSQAANGRYLEALATVREKTPASQLIDPVARRIVRRQRPYRALRPMDRQETRLFQTVMQGRFLLCGFTNRDLREELIGNKSNPDLIKRRRESARTTRLLRLLRAHELIAKVSRSRLYRVTEKGQRIMGLCIALRQADADRIAA
jgi:hypothetical protein